MFIVDGEPMFAIATREVPGPTITACITRPRGVKLGCEFWADKDQVIPWMFPFERNTQIRVFDAPEGHPHIGLDILFNDRGDHRAGPDNPGKLDPYRFMQNKLNSMSKDFQRRAMGKTGEELKLLSEMETLLADVAKTIGAFAPRYISLRMADEGVFEEGK